MLVYLISIEFFWFFSISSTNYLFIKTHGSVMWPKKPWAHANESEYSILTGTTK